MPATVLQQSRGFDTGTSTSIIGSGASQAFSNPILVGSTVLYAIAANTTTATVTCADNSAQPGTANTWTKDVDVNASPAGVACRIVVFRCLVTRTILTSTVITATWSAGLETSGFAIEADGLLRTGSSFDKASAVASGSSSPLTSNATGTLAQAKSFLLAAYCRRSGASTYTFTGETSGMWARAGTQTGSASNTGCDIAWEEVDSTATQTATFGYTGGSTTSIAGVIGAWKCEDFPIIKRPRGMETDAP